MAKPAHTRISMIGRFAGPSDETLEIWNWNLNAENMGLQSPEDLASAAAAINGAYATSLKAHFRSHVQLQRVRVAQLDELGHVLQTGDGQYRQGDSDVIQVGTNGSAYAYPLQAALAVSLVTERAGTAGKGRFFVPMPAITIGTDYRLPTTQVDTFAGACADFIEAVNAALFAVETTDARVSVVSTKGFVSPVTAVRVGLAVDTIRSRRGDLVEDYRTAAVT